MSTINELAKELKETKENIILIYAFNATGKTRLSVEYKNITKNPDDGQHVGVYYNAFSEDLFVWDNDNENWEQNIKLDIKVSSLNRLHSSMTEQDIEAKLLPYKRKYNFFFNPNIDLEKGYDSITFYKNDDTETPIKISRGEERIFVWCFFLALFEVEGWADTQNAHFFIDDPVSSMDEYNIFITADSIFSLIEEHHLKRKIIISTHHIGLFSILFDRLKKGDKSKIFDKLTKTNILNYKNGELKLKNTSGDVFLYHLHLLQTLKNAKEEQLYKYHIVLLRQVIENIASFLGSSRSGFVLSEIGIIDTAQYMDMINSLSHKKAYQYQTNIMSEYEETLFIEILDKLIDKYKFKF